ncbi:CU044_2847 family protein [Streptomyces sp. Wb2n-11]|uniref:CU044_2847 family protein n=1 Tax=Streptomyces sp. Wb2n-11 TaxID=1030533 RepID=UPI000AA4BF40|nr:CU044_2847 family protein [Streptomyces sp. Wb2n-11]
MANGIAQVRLDDGTVVWARVSEVQELDRGGGFRDTGIGDRVVSMAGGLTDVVQGVVQSLRAGLRPPAPVEVAVTFGIELSAQSGKVIGVLADGGGTASVSVSLTWTEPVADPGAGTAPGTGAAPGAGPDPDPDPGPGPGAGPATVPRPSAPGAA